MRDFDLTYVAEKVHQLHPDIPVPVIRQIVKEAFIRIGRVVDSGRDTLNLRKCDIMQIYTYYDRNAVDLEFADLDETKLPTKKQQKAFSLNKRLN